MVRSVLSVTLLGALAFLFHCSSDPAVADDGKKDAAAQGDDDNTGDDDDDTVKDSGKSGNDATSDATSSSSSSGGGDSGAAFTDYSVKGPLEVASEESTTGNDDCDEAVVRYHPAAGNAAATIVLEHGFLGNVGDLASVGEHLASWGFDVVAVTACTNSDHAVNGTALSALADKLQLPAPYFGGFSAGGLAGFLAAKQNTHAAGYVGLDPVDADDLGLNAAPLTVPVRAVFTEPDSFNSNGNFVAVLTKQANAKAVRVVGASHFDAVGSSCADLSLSCLADAPTGEGRHETVLAFATAALLEISGTDATAAGYFTPGSAAYDAHIADGTIEAP
jgi:pimeloyl-ACP methyl ester carboxylesterase